MSPTTPQTQPRRPASEAAPSGLAGRTILQIVPELDAGGAERTTVDLAAALVQAGARALVLARGGRLVAELEAAGAAFRPFPAHSKNPARMIASVAALARLIRRERVALVHARSRAPAWVALLAARATGVPFATTWHGSYSGRFALKRFYNSVMARGDLVIANSEWTAAQIRALHPDAQERIVVIHRGTDLARFGGEAVSPERIRALRERWGVGERSRLVLLAARLTPWKGHEVLLEAARGVLRDPSFGDVVVVFAGDAQGRRGYVERLDRRVTDLGFSGRVRRVGHVKDVPAAIAAASVVTVPSTSPEAFGRVAVEAQAMGVPVVASDCGAAAETVLAPPQAPPDLRTGWRVPPGDADALSAALREALSLTPAARAALAGRARANAERFSLAAMTEATLAGYGRLMSAADPS